MRKATATCDQCGTEESVPIGDAAFGILPDTWIAVTSGRPTGVAVAARQATDLCSWACVGAYAAKQVARA